MVLCNMQTPAETDAVALWSHLGVVRRNNREQKSPHWAEYHVVYLVLFVWEELWTEEKSYMDSREIANSLSKWSRTWE